MITPNQIVKEAENWLGYREKNHANANLKDFMEDAGDGNHTIFQQVAVGWTGDQWCQYFVDGIAVMVTGSTEEAKRLLCQEKLERMTGYTPEGAACFIDAGRWYSIPEVGDVVYFYGRVSSEEGRKRICHTGIVEWVNRGSQTFGTIEGNSNFDGFTTNGGSVARHEYSYANVGGDNRVTGFGRPNYVIDLEGIFIEIGEQKMATRFKLNVVKIGDKGTSVYLLQQLLKCRGFNPGELDMEFGPQTEAALINYQTARTNAGADIGGIDGICGEKTWSDLLALAKV